MCNGGRQVHLKGWFYQLLTFASNDPMFNDDSFSIKMTLFLSVDNATQIEKSIMDLLCEFRSFEGSFFALPTFTYFCRTKTEHGSNMNELNG